MLGASALVQCWVAFSWQLTHVDRANGSQLPPGSAPTLPAAGVWVQQFSRAPPTAVVADGVMGDVVSQLREPPPQPRKLAPEGNTWTLHDLIEQLRLSPNDILEVRPGPLSHQVVVEHRRLSTIRSCLSAILTLGWFGAFVVKSTISLSGLRPGHRDRLLAAEDGLTTVSTRTAHRFFGDLLTLACYQVKSVVVTLDRRPAWFPVPRFLVFALNTLLSYHPCWKWAPVFTRTTLAAHIVVEPPASAKE